MTGLCLDAVSVRFGGTTALDAADVAVAPGSVTGLIGPNGAGKTTALQVLSGFVRPHRGAVLLDGVDIGGWSAARRARGGIGRTFQRAELFPSLSVLDNVAIAVSSNGFGGRDSSRQRSVAVDALATCGIEALSRCEVAELTTGQRRLVELARSIAAGFGYILLDEPAAGLTAHERDRVAAALGHFRERGVGVLLVEHDLGLVAGVCDRIVVLRDGRTAFTGSPADWQANERSHISAVGRRHAPR